MRHQVFSPNSPKTYKEKIERLQQEIEKLPVQAMMSNTQISFTNFAPLKDFGAKNYARKKLDEN